MLHKQKIKPVHRDNIFLSGKISSPQLAAHPGSLLAHFTLTPLTLKSSFQVPI